MFFIEFLKQGVQLQQYPDLCYRIANISCTIYFFLNFMCVHAPAHRHLVNDNIEPKI